MNKKSSIISFLSTKRFVLYTFMAGMSVILGLFVVAVLYVQTHLNVSFGLLALVIALIGGGVVIAIRPWIGFLLLVGSLPLRSFSLISLGAANIRISEAVFLIVVFGFTANLLASGKVNVRKSKIELPLILFLLWMLISFLWASALIPAIVQFSRVLFGAVLFFLSVQIIKSRRMLHQAINTWFIVGFVISLIAIYEFAKSGLPYLIQNIEIASTVYTQTLRSSVFLSPTLLASYLNLSIFFGFGSLLNAKSTKQKIVLFGAIFILVCALILTFSRGGWAGLLVGITYLLYKSKSMKKYFFVGIIILVILLFLFGGVIKNVIVARFFSYTNPQDDIAFQERLMLWRATEKMIKDSPLTGVGIGNSPQMYEKLSSSFPTQYRYTHSLYLNILTELGILGFLLFLSLCVKVAQSIFLFLRKNIPVETRRLCWCFAAGLMSYAVHGILHFHLAERHIWVFLGIGIAFLIMEGDLKNKISGIDNT